MAIAYIVIQKTLYLGFASCIDGEHMNTSKFRAILVIIFLVAAPGISSVIAGLRSDYTIPSSGSISPRSPIVLDDKIAYESEMRAVFFHMSSLRATNDWNLILSTLHEYNISTLVIEGMSPTVAAYPSSVVNSAGLDFITPAIQAAHPLGIDIYISMDVLYQTPRTDWGCVDSNGVAYNWLNPNNPDARNYLKAIVEELLTKYPQIDGFMFDYIRYDWQSTSPNIDYSTYAKASLEQWLGQNITTFPGDFAPGGSRFNEFLEWRVYSITKLVGDMVSWMKAKKPSLKIAAAPWSITGTEYAQCRKLLGQDWADWVMKDYLDWVAPMAYFAPADLETIFRPFVRADIQKGVGGPEGKIPVVIFIANQYPVVKTPQDLANEVAVLREEGADGWIIWKYGGPGATEVGVDITPYLGNITTLPFFSIKDISVYPSMNNATITWVTDISTTSRVEYSENPLFTASPAYDPIWNFNYTNITHNTGNLVEDLTKVTFHSVTISGLAGGKLYYLRVQSEDSRIATSKVYSFSISE
jgi:hypothetical protein